MTFLLELDGSTNRSPKSWTANVAGCAVIETPDGPRRAWDHPGLGNAPRAVRRLLDNSTPLDQDFGQGPENTTSTGLPGGSMTTVAIAANRPFGQHVSYDYAPRAARHRDVSPDRHGFSKWNQQPMSTSNPEFFEAQKFSPETYDRPPRERGCFFYGCLFASIIALLVLIAAGVAGYFLYRATDRFVQEYTATEPRELPKVELPAEERKSLEERVESFRKAIDNGDQIDPLVLTGDDINAWIESHTELKGKIYVSLEGDKVKAKISLPLSDIVDIGMTRGRYLNGEAELKASLEDGIPIVTIETFEVNGKKPPETFLAQLRRENLVKDMYRNPENAAKLRRLESVEIKDGRMIIKARAKKEGPDSKPASASKESPAQVQAPAEAGKPSEKPSQNGPDAEKKSFSPNGDAVKKP